MNITARIDEINVSTTYPDQNGGQVDEGDVYISIYNSDTNQPANGNNCEVTYQVNDYGAVSNHTVVIPGQSYLLYSGVIRESRYASDGDQYYGHWIAYSILSVKPGNNPSPNPGTCNLNISHITVDKPASAPGAADARITVSASSGYVPISYSIDAGLNWQTSPVFSGLHGGVVHVMVKDGNPLGCTDMADITIPVLTSLLTGDPSVTLPNGYISRWNAAFNPIVFTYQRKDFSIKSIVSNADKGHAQISVNGSFNDAATGTTKVKPGDKVYISSNDYNGIYTIETVTGSNSMVIDTPFTGNSTSGFININSMYPYYELHTRISYTDNVTGSTTTIKSINRPDNTGLIRTDISNFLQSLLHPYDDTDYTLADIRDTNLCATYTIEYAQHYDDGTDDGFTTAYSQVAQPYYVVYAAKQLGSAYGGNIALNVPNTLPNAQPALWITDFAEPAYSAGYPFDIGFLFTSEMLGLQPYCQLTLLDINRNQLPGGDSPPSLKNEDGSWIIAEDGNKFSIGNQTSFKIPLTAATGLHRLMINASFPAEAFYFSIQVKYDDESGTKVLTAPQTIRIDDAVDDNSVYLRWIGLNGSWNYYRFVYNQEVSLDVQNAVIIKNYVQNWQNQQGIEEVISKNAGQKMKVVAEDLSVNDIRGLQSIKYSPKVQLLVNKNPVKWQTIVINTATYNEYETRNGQAPFSLTFNMPSINIQTQ